MSTKIKLLIRKERVNLEKKNLQKIFVFKKKEFKKKIEKNLRFLNGGI